MTAQLVTIVVSPEPHNPNKPAKRVRFNARLAVDGRELGAFSAPLCGSARVLLSQGALPSTELQMRHAGTDVVALTATLGVAAGLTVEEEGPRFVKWRPFSASQEASEATQ
jgi:hypothetical protein